MSRTTRLLLFAVAGLGAVGSVPAHAQDWRMMYFQSQGFQTNYDDGVMCTDPRGFAHRTNHAMTWYLNPSGQGWGKDAAIQGALSAWTNVANADFDLAWGGWDWYAGYEQNDGVNALVWRNDDPFCNQRSCGALTSLLMGPDLVIQEADIIFNENQQWMTDGQFTYGCWMGGATGIMMDTQGIATHELGHAMGIAHPINEFTTAATMGTHACTPDARSLEGDDVDALRCSEDRYPVSPSYQGALQSVGCQEIKGWAYNANQSYQRSYVEIDEDLGGGPSLLGITHADLYSPLLGGLPDPYHAFSYSPTGNRQLYDGEWHTISARYSGNQANVGFSYLLMCEHKMFPESMGPSQQLAIPEGESYEVGTTFTSDYAGYISQIGYYFAYGESAAPSHTVKLWTESGQLLASAAVYPPVNQLHSGWAYAPIERVRIDPNVNYRASVDTYEVQSKSPCGEQNSLASPYVSSPLTALGGAWKTGVGQMPDVGSCSNFFVSVTYESG